MANKPEHHERHGACASCYEEWPCAVARGEKVVSGIQEWGQDELMIQALEESNRRVALNRHTNVLLSRLRLSGSLTTDDEYTVPDFACGTMIKVELLHELVCLAVENEVMA